VATSISEGPSALFVEKKGSVNFAHALTCLRLVLTPVFICLLESGAHRVHPETVIGGVLVFTLICVSDYFDGPLARYLGRDSDLGKIFDNLADITFLLVTLAYLVYREAVLLWIPLAIALAFLQYTVDSWLLSRSRRAVALVSNPIGHWVGILNYTLVGIFSLDFIVQYRLLPWPLHPFLSLLWLTYLLAAMVVRLRFFLQSYNR
jgi:phosphatidylglycerophosphate synthase